MKKLIYAFTAVVSLVSTSCSNDVSDSISTMAYPTLNLVTPADGSTPYITPSTYSFMFNISQGKAALTLNSMSFENTPYTFSTDTLRYNSYTYQTSSGVGMLLRIDGLSAYMNGDRNYPVKNINCDINGLFYWFNTSIPGYAAASWNAADPSMVIMQYDAQGLFSVQTMQPESFYYGETTVITNGVGETYKGTTPVYRLKVNSDYKTADFIMYNAKFSDDTDQVRAIILEKIPFTFENGGYALKATNVVPKVYLGTNDGTTLEENPDYKIGNFLFATANKALTEVSLDYTIDGKYSVTVAQMSYVIEKND